MTLAEWMRSRLSDAQRFLVLCVLAGFLCGLTAVAFHFSIHHIFDWLWNFASGQDPFWFCVVLGAPTLGGAACGICVHYFVPDAAGSGIPQTKAAYYNKGGKISSKTGVMRFVLGSLYVGLGNSLGREGPTVHVSAAIASRIGRWAFKDPARVQSMLPVGMAAGIAAAFNAPLSALTFVFEELLDNFSMKAIGGMVIAVVIAAAVSRTMLGEDPVLMAKIAEDYKTSAWMLVALPLGVAAGLIGHVFVISTLNLRVWFKSRKTVPFVDQSGSGWTLLRVAGAGGVLFDGQSWERTEFGFQHRLPVAGGGFRIQALHRNHRDPAGGKIPRGGDQLRVWRLRRVVFTNAFPWRNAGRADRRRAGGFSDMVTLDSGFSDRYKSHRWMRAFRHGGDVRGGGEVPDHLPSNHF